MKRKLLFTCSLALLIVTSCRNDRYPDALSPEESIKKFELDDRFKIEIFAAEPFVFDPVCMEFDEDGNVYVVEMPDYPYKPEPGKELGRIRVLKDTNQDGRIDEAIVFAEKLSEGTSILPWKGGLLVTAAPDILYLKDTTGDFVADTRQVLFSGFFKNNSEVQITSLRFSVDNWIYANNRGQEGNITFQVKADASPLSVRGADFRFRLDQEKFEAETGPGQFGQTINDFGHRFFTENTLHINQSIIPWRYTHRHDYMGGQRFVENISDHELDMFQQTEPPYWRAERTRRRNEQYQASKLNRVEYAEDKFTGASGGTIYSATAFPAEFNGNIFTGDVAGNLVHRDIITLPKNQTAYVAKRSEGESAKEFLASTDSWFRPTNFSVGPDGYLYVLDYYRQHIETPVSIPDDLKEDMDFMAGSDRGRIYRIMPKDSAFRSVRPQLSKADNNQLVEYLNHPHLWWRMQAQRLLLERGDKSVIPVLRKYFNATANPVAKLHIIYLLDALGGLDAGIVKTALEDQSAGLRENALILAEGFRELKPMIKERIKDSVLRVALQAGLSIGNDSSSETTEILFSLLQKHGNDKWIRRAVLSSVAGSSTGFLRLTNNAFFADTVSWKTNFMEELSFVVGARNDKSQLEQLMNFLHQQVIQENSGLGKAAVKGLVNGLKTSAAGSSAENKKKLDELSYETTEQFKQILAQIKTIAQSS